MKATIYKGVVHVKEDGTYTVKQLDHDPNSVQDNFLLYLEDFGIGKYKCQALFKDGDEVEFTKVIGAIFENIGYPLMIDSANVTLESYPKWYQLEVLNQRLRDIDKEKDDLELLEGTLMKRVANLQSKLETNVFTKACQSKFLSEAEFRKFLLDNKEELLKFLN